MKNSVFNEELKAPHNRYFSEDFKKKRIRELENNLISIPDICKTYHVSRTSVYRWIYKYSSMANKNEKQVVESKSDTKKIQLMEERIKELERALGQKQMLIDIKDKIIEIAEETYDIDIKKKLASKVSSGSSTIGKSTDTK
ncbi:MAG: helix-turn-helix domain-containing protein [Bacteroides sp.]|nr:helix-turn-helix domain-containing protein [Bacteroides sp.]